MAANGTATPLDIVDGWTKNEKIKTCKCETCGDRVRFWSHKCAKCGRHICSECLDPSSNKTSRQKQIARDHVLVVCWCKYRSNMNPAFRENREPPPVRTTEETRAKEAKNLGASRKAAKVQGESSKPTETSRKASSSPTAETSYAQRDGDYDEMQSTEATMTANRPHRGGLKRKTYVERDSDDDPFVDRAIYKPKKLKAAVLETGGDQSDFSEQDGTINPLDRLRGATTVIVGAGVVGLFIARELAMAVEAKVKHNITVVEIRKGHCELASGHCAGFLTASGVSEARNAMVTEAQNWWHGEIGRPSIRQQLKFDFNTAVKVIERDCDQDTGSPSWLRQGADFAFEEDSDAIGQLDPKALALWLHHECRRLDVNFRFGHFVSNVTTDEDGSVSEVQLENANVEDAPPVHMKCSNLILAAGPFTTGIFNALFPHTTLELDNHIQSSNWFHIDASTIPKTERTALRFPDAAEGDEKLTGEIRMAPNAKGDTIAISGTSSRIRNKDFKFEDDLAREIKPSKTRELRAIASNYLAEDLTPIEKNDMIRDGRSELSVASGGGHFIDGLSVSDIGLSFEDEAEDLRQCGVWLCYGFGMHGTMLAPGAARLLVNKILGQDTSSDVERDDDSSSLSESTSPPYKGKGKARAW